MKEMIAFEPPETVVMTLQGQLDPKDIAAAFEKWANHYGTEKKVKVLVDLSKLEEVPPKAREAMKEWGRKFQISKVAPFGASAKMRVMAGLVLKMVPQVDKSTFFKTEAEARAWLEKK